MTVAVTGASGHIGANLVRALLEHGRHVRVLEHNHNQGYKGLDVEVVKGNVCDIKSLNRLFDGADVVYHLAAKIYLGKGKDQETESINIMGTQNVAHACLANNIKKLIHFSSVHALSPFPMYEVVDENRAFISGNASSCYDLSKAAGEQEVLKAVQNGLDAVILNPCGVVGPFDFMPSAMGRLMKEMSDKRFLILCKGGFNWVDVRDVTHAALNAEKHGKTGARYLLSGEWLSLPEISLIISRITNKFCYRYAFSANAAACVAHFVEAYGRLMNRSPSFTYHAVKTLQHYRHVSCEKAKKDLHFKPRPIQESISDTLQWHKDRL